VRSRSRIRGLAAVIGACALLTPGAAHAGTADTTRDYITSAGISFGQCSTGEGARFGHGCVELADGDTLVRVAIADQVGRNVGAIASFHAPGIGPIAGAGGTFCGSATFDVPPNALTLYVFVTADSSARAALGCEAGFATRGSIDFDFS
jgi:hypothetical protein